MRFLPYSTTLKEFSKQLRNNSTLAEVLLWNQLKNKQFLGYQFYRQKPIGKYIVDFYCPKLRLVIEVDGDSHLTDEAMIKDPIRQKILEDMGVHFLRLDDFAIKKNMSSVLLIIDSYINGTLAQ